jgi:CRP-like cAMP-binding protein
MGNQSFAVEPSLDHRPSNNMLRRAPLFSGMTDRTLQAVAELADEVEYVRGESIVREGDEGDAFYILSDGVAVVEQEERAIRTLSAGAFFGEISLIDGKPRSASVIATQSVRAVRVSRAGFQRLLDEHPSVRLELLMALTERLRKVAPNPTD